MDRRKFLVVSGAAAVLPGLPACGAGGGEVDELEEDFTFRVSDFPGLATPGNTVFVDAGLFRPLAVTLVSAGNFVVTSSECTHQSCQVMRNGDGFRCPCHGSRFSLEGEVEQGPAGSPLTQYDWELDGDSLTVLA